MANPTILSTTTGITMLSGGVPISGSNLTLSGTVSQVAGVSTVGTFGVPVTQQSNIGSVQTGNATIFTFVPQASVGSILAVYGAITTTSGTNTGTVQFTLDYHDNNGNVHTGDIIPLIDASGVLAATKTGASLEFHSTPWLFTTDGSASNVVLKVVTTGTVHYFATAYLARIN